MIAMGNEILDKDWEGCREIVLFGYGRQRKRVFGKLSQDFHVIGVVENDIRKCNRGGVIEDVPIWHFEDAVPVLMKYKVVVTVSEHYYREIKTQLEAIGLEEHKDFVMAHQFVSEWYFKYKKEIVLLKTDLSVTAKCSLNCAKCALFMPYWKEKKERDAHKIREDLDLYFDTVDYVLDMDLVGGEPFLYEHLEEIINYIGDRYRGRIGYLGIITNGTIIPSERILKALHQHKVGVSISDYTAEADYQERMEHLCGQLEKNQIPYQKNTAMDWFDFGFPDQRYQYQKQEALKHMQACNTVCHTLDDSKVFYCGTAWAAGKSGLFPVHENDYVDLKHIHKKDLSAKKEIIEHCLGQVKGGYLEFCRVCGGYGNDNRNKVPAGRQLYGSH